MRLGILISGRGSNFEAIANSIARRKLDAEIAIVISNRANAPGLEIARERGIPLRVIASAGVERDAYDKLLIEELQTHAVDLVCLAGFMRLLSTSVIRALPQSGAEHSSFSAARIHGTRCAKTSPRVWRQDHGMHGALCR